MVLIILLKNHWSYHAGQTFFCFWMFFWKSYNGSSSFCMCKIIFLEQFLVFFDLFLIKSRHLRQIFGHLVGLRWRGAMGLNSWDILLRMIYWWWRWLLTLVIRLSLWLHAINSMRILYYKLSLSLYSYISINFRGWEQMKVNWIEKLQILISS